MTNEYGIDETYEAARADLSPVADFDLSPISRAVGVIHETCNNAIVTADSFPDLFAVLDVIQAVSAKLRELKAQAEAHGIELLDRDGECVIGEDRYYVGREKRTKPKDKAAVLDALFQLAQDDMKRAAEYFSSDPFKYGAIRTAIETDGGNIEGGPAFDDLFDTTEVPDLKTGKPKRAIKSINPVHCR